MINPLSVRRRILFVLLLLLLALGLSLAAAPAGHTRGRLQISPPAFVKGFTPPTVGPGSSSTLTFAIDNTEATPVGDLAFTDILPAGLTLATPSGAVTTCGDGTVEAPSGGTTITLSGGRLGANSMCTVVVNVTAGTTPGVYTNTSGDLTSDAGNSGPATADLTVDAALPGFSKSFAPGTIYTGETSTLTFTLDNSAGGADRFNATFSDPLPDGVVVASPANLAATCIGTPSAEPGANAVSLFGAFLSAGSTCTLTVDVTATSTGAKNNVSNSLTSTAGDSGFATALLEVDAPPPFHKSFTNQPTPPGGTTTLEFSIRNMDRRNPATGITFTDDLDAALTGLTATGLPAVDVCGSGSQLSGTSTLTLTGGSLGAGETCTFTTTVQVPAAAAPGTYVNTTGDLTSDAGFMASSATNDLEVAPIPSLQTSFIPDTVGTGETVDMAFTLGNNSQTSAATDMSFNQILGDVLPGATVMSLPAAGFCGPGSIIAQTSGPPFNALTLVVADASLAAGADCTFTVTLALSPSTPNGAYTLTSSAPQATVGGETLTGHPASAELTVVAPPQLSKSFTDDPVTGGETVTLEFTLTHSENAPGPATDVTFTDDLDAVLPGLTAVGLPADDVCGPGSSLTGASLLTFTGGEVAPASSCSFTVTLQTPAGASSGSYTNVTSQIAATVDGFAVSGNAASADLEIAGLFLSKSFSEGTVVQDDAVNLTFTLTNESLASAADIAFTDDLDAMLPGLTAVDLPPGDVCGTGSSLTGTSLLTFTGGTLAPGASCTFSATLDVPAGATSGEYENVTSPVTADLGGSPVTADPASAELIVLDVLSFAKSFDHDAAAAGETITLTFTITNNSAGSAGTDLSFTDDLDAALAGLAAVSLPPGDVCGTGSSLTGTSLLTLTGGALGPGETCTFAAELQIPAGVPAGTTATNVTSAISGSLGGEAVTGPAATAELDVLLFAFTKSIAGPTVAGATPTLTFTIENLAGTEQSGLGFIDDLDAVLAGLAASGLPAADVCGTGSTLSGTSTVTFSSGVLAAGQSCVFTVTLQVPAAAAPGTYTNTTSELTSAGLTVSAPATDTLDVEPPPTFAKDFAPNPILLGGVSTLTFTVDNGASAVAAADLAFTDNLPAGLTVATPANASTTCNGGTLTAPAGGTTITYTGGTVAAGSSCTLQVDVAGAAPGSHVNATGPLTSSSGSSGTASDTLTVNPPPAFSKLFAPNPIPLGATTTLTFTVDNGASTVAATALDFTDNLPAALSIATPANAATTCIGGTLTAPTGGSTITYTGGTVAAGDSCTVSVDVTGDTAGTYTNTTGVLTSSLGASGTASDTLTVNPPPGFGKRFAPDAVDVGESSTLTLTIDNGASTVAAADLAFADNLPSGLIVATPANASTTCSGGTLTAPAGGTTITYSGGTVPVGATCVVAVDVTGDAAGEYDNVSSALTSSLGNSGTATDTLLIAIPAISLDATALPTSVPEPGGDVLMTVVITNETPVESLTLEAMADDVHGDLDGHGTCVVPAVLGIGQSYTCTYTATITGNAGDTFTNTVTATAVDADDNEATAQHGAAITVADVLPTVQVRLTATPTVVAAPGAPVTFTARVTNTGSAEAVTLTSLADELAGDLDGVGACSLPATIPAGSAYQCTYSAEVTGEIGDAVANTVTAEVEDDDGNQASAQDGATVHVRLVVYHPLMLKGSGPTNR